MKAKALILGANAIVLSVVGLCCLEHSNETPGRPAYTERLTGQRIDAPVSTIDCGQTGARLYELQLSESVLSPLRARGGPSAEYPRRAGYQEGHVLVGWHAARPQADDAHILVTAWDAVNLALQSSCDHDPAAMRERLRNAIDRPTTWLACSYLTVGDLVSVMSLYVIDVETGVLYDIEYAA